MSREQLELRRLGRIERRVAWTHAKRLPARVGDTASAFARRHPVWAMGGAAAIAMSIAGRRRRKFGIEGKPSSWTGGIAALGVHVLPHVLRLVGLSIPTGDANAEGAPAERQPAN